MAEDIWSNWLKHRRFGDAINKEKALQQYRLLALNIIKRAELFESATVLDIGTGDGLLGLTAIDYLGNTGKIIFNDISEAALDIPKSILNENKNIKPKIEYALTNAENLNIIQSESIDRILIRAVIMYIKNKQSVFNEFHRILKKHGIAVINETINERQNHYKEKYFYGFDIESEPLNEIIDIIEKVKKEIKKQKVQSGQGTMTGYDEHSLIDLAINAGFNYIKLEYDLEYFFHKYMSWDYFFNASPNPNAQSLNEIMKNILSNGEYFLMVSKLKEVFDKNARKINCQASYILKKI